VQFYRNTVPGKKFVASAFYQKTFFYMFWLLTFTVVAIEVLIKYCNNSLPNIDQFIWSEIAQLPVYWHACSQLVNQSLKRKAIGWFKHTGSWSIFQRMNWSTLSNELMQYFINTSIATTVMVPHVIWKACTQRLQIATHLSGMCNLNRLWKTQPRMFFQIALETIYDNLNLLTLTNSFVSTCIMKFRLRKYIYLPCSDIKKIKFPV
jgi:hypothetical protein